MSDRRRFLHQLAAAGLLGCVPALTQQILAAGTRPAAPGFYQVRGNVTLNGQAAAPGMLVRPGDTVVTGPGSEAVYVIGQDAYLQRADSTVSFIGDTVTRGLRILSGRLMSVFGRGQDKTLTTTTATIGIRGTGCYIEAAAARMYICLCYGEADFTPQVAPDRSMRLVTRHHESPVWISGEDRKNPITPAPMINHSDAELTLLENLVGRNPPFLNSGKDY